MWDEWNLTLCSLPYIGLNLKVTFSIILFYSLGAVVSPNQIKPSFSRLVVNLNL